ncbi:A-kinase anchor protein [Intoshia linei]|uniref:A-kinase anchor protein n=1 Tax=Intoshia linei TaxID=1819745 RepID=A0A177BAR6_9BILA|nr:A-kinase anchor protein [Intoshia linei]
MEGKTKSLDVQLESQKLISLVLLNSSEEKTTSDLHNNFIKFCKLQDNLYNQNVDKEHTPKPIQDIKIGLYNSECARQKIVEIINSWSFNTSWKYFLEFIGTEDREFDTRHYFETRWSIPTRQMPVPRATASIYFTFIVSKIKPKNEPVEIHYTLECWRFIIKRIDQLRFRQEWLKQIIESKIKCTNFLGF